MKKFLTLLLTCLVVVGCGGGDSDRLTKEEYVKSVSDKMIELSREMTTISANATKEDLKKMVDKINKSLDEVIALQGPKELEKQEEQLDSALEDMKEVLELSAQIPDDPSKASEYAKKYSEFIDKLQKAQAAYQSEK